MFKVEKLYQTMLMLNAPSQEQQKVVSAIANCNVRVIAKAGTGKTTTALHIASKYPEQSILLLTFNKKLKQETRERVDSLGLENISVHSFHSFCVKYYNPKTCTDVELLRLLRDNTSRIKSFSYEIIIIDEVQDMSEDYHSLVCKIIKDNESESRICVFGDPDQCIFKFKDADTRYLENASEYFSNGLKWKYLELKVSFRITTGMADAVNGCYGSNRIKAIKEGSKPRYCIVDVYSENIVTIVQNVLAKYKPEDVFILAPSINKKTPVKVLANKLTAMNYDLYVSLGDSEIPLDADLLRHKLCITTLHQSKGLERKVVILFNFDMTFYFYNHNSRKDVISNELYVGLTRATEKLFVLQSHDHASLEFLQQQPEDFFKIIVLDNPPNRLKQDKHKPKLEYTVTECLKFIKSRLMLECIDALTITKLMSHGSKPIININYKTKQNHLYEYVGDITGTAIPILYYSKKRKYQEIEDSDIVSTLKKCNRNNSKTTGYDNRTRQIRYYDWLSKKVLLQCFERIDSLKLINPTIEKELVGITNERVIRGYADAVDNNDIYEFKCSRSELSSENILQVAFYCVLNKSDTGFLYNILTNELLKINVPKVFSNYIIEILKMKN